MPPRSSPAEQPLPHPAAAASPRSGGTEPNPHVPRTLSGVLRRVMAGGPADLVRIARAAWATLMFRHVVRCTGPSCVFGTGNRIINARNVRIGAGCLFQDGIYIRAGAKARIEIGDRVAFNSFVRLFGHGGIRIGDDTQLGPGVLITTTSHNYGQDLLEATFEPVTLGKGVWVGANVTILPGVTIGDGAVIGAGAVVNRDIPARTLAAGVPVRVIRRIGEAAGDATPERRPEPAMPPAP